MKNMKNTKHEPEWTQQHKFQIRSNFKKSKAQGPKWVSVQNQNPRIKDHYKQVIDVNWHEVIGYSCIRKDFVQRNGLSKNIKKIPRKLKNFPAKLALFKPKQWHFLLIRHATFILTSYSILHKHV